MSLLAFLEDSSVWPKPVVAITEGENTSFEPRREIRINIRTDGAIGSGVADDPYNGSTDELLDSLLSNEQKIPSGATIRFGPGIFQTKGIGGPDPGFTPLSRQRFIGSGMHQTTLQLVKGRPQGTTALRPGINRHGRFCEDIEITDMTLDCNLTRQSLDANGDLALITASAIGFSVGTRIRLRRLRIINWGTHTPISINGVVQPPLTKTNECFPIFIVSGANGATGEAVVEDCIIEQPALSQARESSLLLSRAHRLSENFLSTIQNNYLNGDYTTGGPPPPISVMSLVESPAGKVKLVTQWPHRVQAGDYVHITGCASNPNYNGRHKVDSADDFREFRIEKGTLGNLPSDSGVEVQHYVPRAMRVTLNRTGATVTLRTPMPHLRIVGDWVRISGAKLAGTQYSEVNNSFNGAFLVASVPNDNELTYVMDSDPGSNPLLGSEIWLDRWPSQQVVVREIMWESAGLASVRTAAPHFKIPGEFVLIDQVGGSPEWNGFFKVEKWNLQTNNSFLCKLNTSTKPTVDPTYGTAMIPQNFQGTTAITGSAPIIRANRVIGLKVAGPYHDIGDNTTRLREMVIWDNYYFFVLTGAYSPIGNGFADVPAKDNREGIGVKRLIS